MNLEGYKNCQLFCSDCLKTYSNKEGAYKYWSLVHAREVRLKWHPILNKNQPYVHCRTCGGLTARVLQIQEPKKENIPITDKLKITKGELIKKRELNKEKYAKDYGKSRLEKDFLQPYKKGGEVNKDFLDAYAHDKEIISKTYKEEDIKKTNIKIYNKIKKEND